MKILWLTNVPSPYRVDFFRELGKTEELTVLFEMPANTRRKNPMDPGTFSGFRFSFLKGLRLTNNMAFCPGVIRQIRRAKDSVIVVHDPASPTGLLATAYLRARRIPYAIESDGGLPGTGKGWKERAKRLIYRGAACYFTTSRLGEEHLICYGAPEDRIFRYPFTSVSREDVLSAPPSPEEKRRLREKLEIRGDRMVVSVGQFIHRKGFDILLRAAAGADRDTSFVLIGDEPTREYLDAVAENHLDNVYFVSFKNKAELGEYYRAADLFVLPTRYDIWGLVVNEAMAKGLPVISTTTCVAATELVEQGANGYLYPCEDCGELTRLLELTLSDPAFLQAAGERSLEIIGGYTVEEMAQVHRSLLERKWAK